MELHSYESPRIIMTFSKTMAMSEIWIKCACGSVDRKLLFIEGIQSMTFGHKRQNLIL
jgi:hypothetical protein